MEIPEHILDRATEFALKYSNRTNELAEIRLEMKDLLESRVRLIESFGGTVIWTQNRI